MNIDDPFVAIINMLFLASMIHGFFLSGLVYRSNQASVTSKLLSLELMILSVWILNFLFYTTGWIIGWPHLMNVCVPILYLVGPIFLFIAKSLNSREFRFQKWDILNLIPFLAILLLSIPEFLLSSAEKLEKVNAVFSKSNFQLMAYVLGNKLNFFTIGYGLYALRYLKDKTVENPFFKSYTRILKLVVALFFLKIFLLPILHLIGLNAAHAELLMVLVIATTIHIMGYYYFKSLTTRGLRAVQQPANGRGGKYHTSPLQKAEIDEFVIKIKDLFESEKPWKDPKFSIDELSKVLKIPKHHLSQVINKGLQLNFHELVNNYRVREVINRLESGAYKGYSISGIGADCGFNSASTFHRAFKKITGVTPSKFIQTIETQKS